MHVRGRGYACISITRLVCVERVRLIRGMVLVLLLQPQHAKEEPVRMERIELDQRHRVAFREMRFGMENNETTQVELCMCVGVCCIRPVDLITWTFMILYTSPLCASHRACVRAAYPIAAQCPCH